MSIPHARRPPIPNFFENDFSPIDKKRPKPLKNTDDHHDIEPSAQAVIFPPTNARQVPLSPHRHFILPAPSEKTVKYVPFTRGSKPNYTRRSATFNNQNNKPVFLAPASPAQTSEASDESTLVASSPASYDEEFRGPTRVFAEKTNFIMPDYRRALNEGSPPSPQSPVDGKANDESYELTAISNSSDAMMNNSETAHLETAASLRSIRSTLDRLRKKRSVSRSGADSQFRSRAPVEQILRINTSINLSIHSSDNEEHDEPKASRTETVSDLVHQLLDIIRPRRCPDHKSFMAKWSSSEYEAYKNRWNKILKSVTTPQSRSSPLRFSEIPWPVFPALVAITPCALLITTDNLNRFLICKHDDNEVSLKKITEEIDRWDNFRVMDTILANVGEKDRSKVEEAWSLVVMLLMKIRAEYSGESESE